jgi:hypothetical protein
LFHQLPLPDLLQLLPPDSPQQLPQPDSPQQLPQPDSPQQLPHPHLPQQLQPTDSLDTHLMAVLFHQTALFLSIIEKLF